MDMLLAYRTMLAEHRLQPDEGQAQVVRRLTELCAELNAAPPGGSGSLFGFFRKKPVHPRGLYLYGNVGRGKTMLMDLFYVNVEGWPKQRIHFHAFMQDIHKARAQQKTIEQIADQLAKDTTLLCLDEMQITDIADAMIVGRLFEAMHQRGLVLVTTSNLAPDALYRDGLNRDLFQPFIEKLKAALDVVCLDSPKDYRLGRVKARDTYLHPNVEWKQDEFAQLWNVLTDDAKGTATTLNVLGRKLVIPAAARGCAAFAFEDLCRDPLGPADFLAIAQAYRTVFVHVIPALKAHERNELKRFILMIDTFYDTGTRLVALADVPPEGICPKNLKGIEFARTLSRLREMQSASWWGKTIIDT